MIGVDYYPEHWPHERFSTDLEMMKEIGIRVVRMGEFSWSRMEPREGEYRFDWLREYVRGLGDAGAKVILGTPTASAPPWLAHKYPEALIKDYRGFRANYGVRRQFCPNNPDYRNLSAKIVKELVREFAREDNVVGYQIDNELHFAEGSSWCYCYCRHCIAGFRDHLRQKYSSVQNLNTQMGTAFWSHEYGHWDEIDVPTPPFDLMNRPLTLEWIRYRSRIFVEFLRLQAQIIKSVDPAKTMTTTLMGLYPEIDYFDLCSGVDVASTDVYPRFARDEYNPADLAMIYDATRCMSPNKGFWVMELQAGPADGYTIASLTTQTTAKIGVTPEPGELRKWYWQAIAHGASQAVFFNWRTNPSGKEQFWHGILDHAGTRNRRYEEVKQIGREVALVESEIGGSTFESEVAILLSYDSLWASEVIEAGYYDTTYLEVLRSAYQGMYEARLPVDVIGPNHDFSKYKVLLAPFLYVADDGLIRKIKDFTRNGGTLVTTARSFVKDELDRVRTEPLLSILEGVFGGTVREYSRLPASANGVSITMEKDSPYLASQTVPCNAWVDAFDQNEGCDVLGRHTYRWLSGSPAVLRKSYGAGESLVIGTFPDSTTWSRLARDLILRRKIEQIVVESSFQKELEYAALKKVNATYIFIINHSPTHVSASFSIKQRRAESLLHGRSHESQIKLALDPHGLDILKAKD